MKETAMTLLADKIAIITGAGADIGRCSARRMASEGASIVATDIDEGAALETALQITESGGTAIGLRHDVTDESRWIEVVNKTMRQLGGVADVVVFLASDRATYLTGAEFVIDGGAMNTIMI
nr:SDR family oxidoreductase [Mycolicibacterium sp. CH28]